PGRARAASSSLEFHVRPEMFASNATGTSAILTLRNDSGGDIALTQNETWTFTFDGTLSSLATDGVVIANSGGTINTANFTVGASGLVVTFQYTGATSATAFPAGNAISAKVTFNTANTTNAGL